MMRNLALGVLIVGTLPAQRKKTPKIEKWRIDPYTKNEPAALERAGYVRYFPFDFGELASKPISAREIERQLGYPKILWVETAHFKIASSLPSFAIPASDRKLKKKIEAELTRLKKKIPRIRTNVRRLDPWLRLHMFAQRCEDVYAEFSHRLGVTKDSFPTKRSTLLNGRYMGEGQYLGQQAKYTVLMMRKASDYTRYLSLFIGRTQEFAQRWNFKTIGSQFIGTSVDLEPRLKHDTSLHCHIVWNVVHNMINGYRYYSYDLPVWFTEGTAHWFSREVSRKYALDFDQNESARADMLNKGDWEAKTLKWMSRFRPCSELLQIRDFGQLTKYDHVKSWSVVDYLMSLGDEKWAAYMNEIKGYIDPKTGLAVASQVAKLQRRGLRKVYGVSPLQLEERWKAWALDNYATK